MIINRTINKKEISDAYGVHVKDAYELVKMKKVPSKSFLGTFENNIREIQYNLTFDTFVGSNTNQSTAIDIKELQPLMDQLVSSETPYDKERFSTFKLDVSEDKYKEWFLNKNKNCHDLIYLDNSFKHILGFVRYIISDRTMDICNFVVNTNSRGNGIGRILLQKLENIALKNKCETMCLSCYRINKAIKLYKSFGFKEYKKEG